MAAGALGVSIANDATRKHLTFHDLRAIGITWMALRGDGQLKIMSRAGHSNFATTPDYIQATQVLVDGFGEVFPEAPSCPGRCSLRATRLPGAVTQKEAPT